MIKLKDNITAVQFDRDNLPDYVDTYKESMDDASGIYEFTRYSVHHQRIEPGDFILSLPDGKKMVLSRWDAERFFDIEEQ